MLQFSESVLYVSTVINLVKRKLRYTEFLFLFSFQFHDDRPSTCKSEMCFCAKCKYSYIQQDPKYIDK